MKSVLLSTVWALMVWAGPAAVAETAPAHPVVRHITASPAEAAWGRYRATLDAQRKQLLESQFARDPLNRSLGLYFLQSEEVTAFNMYVAPRQQYPALYKDSVFSPFELSWGLPNPDFLYRYSFIDGAHTYRIYGNKKGNYWATLQVFRAFWGEGVKDTQTIENVDFDQLPADANGDFEIDLGPNPPAAASGKHWIKTDPADHNVTLILREVFNDWSSDRPMDLHIETLDRDADAPIYVGEADLAARIDKARNFVTYNFDYTMHLLNKLAKYPTNTLVLDQDARHQGGNPLACYSSMIYDLKPDEALIIDSRMTAARYWGVQLGTLWSHTLDYSYHVSSINRAQARADADGHVRAVLALKDPGVPNWLDPVGVPNGLALVRYYRSPECLTPTVRKVKLADLRNNLPADTPVVTPEQRREQLEVRRKASLARYGE